MSGASVAAVAEPRVVGEGPVDRDGVGVDEQLGRVEPQPGAGVVGAVGAQAVARAGAERLDQRR